MLVRFAHASILRTSLEKKTLAGGGGVCITGIRYLLGVVATSDDRRGTVELEHGRVTFGHANVLENKTKKKRT
jgi:hypothetical protein